MSVVVHYPIRRGGRKGELIGHIKISLADLSRVRQFNRNLNPKGYLYAYLPVSQRQPGQGERIALHHLICPPHSGLQVDHINADPFDNRRENLRLCTNQQNQVNKRYRAGSSGFRGVTRQGHSDRWQAQISVNGRKLALGIYEDVLDAARAYNAAAKLHHGEFAVLNVIPEQGAA